MRAHRHLLREGQIVKKEELFPHEGSQAVEQMPRGAVQFLPLEVIRTQMDTD